MYFPINLGYNIIMDTLDEIRDKLTMMQARRTTTVIRIHDDGSMTEHVVSLDVQDLIRRNYER